MNKSNGYETLEIDANNIEIKSSTPPINLILSQTAPSNGSRSNQIFKQNSCETSKATIYSKKMPKKLLRTPKCARY